MRRAEVHQAYATQLPGGGSDLQVFILSRRNRKLADLKSQAGQKICDRILQLSRLRSYGLSKVIKELLSMTSFILRLQSIIIFGPPIYCGWFLFM